MMFPTFLGDLISKLRNQCSSIINIFPKIVLKNITVGRFGISLKNHISTYHQISWSQYRSHLSWEYTLNEPLLQCLCCRDRGSRSRAACFPLFPLWMQKRLRYCNVQSRKQGMQGSPCRQLQVGWTSVTPLSSSLLSCQLGFIFIIRSSIAIRCNCRICTHPDCLSPWMSELMR